ncbi:unnamed protein product [Prorocentrum cordatum]|uniref:Uncharacterized protein n=1 Tax=Prorocentrum cordatum TaxID=2364126 RepID=A0ABN9XNQ9_9DINO|nr:unnamed protein product [Polarella glacialis]
MYRFDEFNDAAPGAPRSLAVGMSGYLKKLACRFREECGELLPRVTSPFISDTEWVDSSEGRGRFQANCASYVAAILFSARVCRSDCTTAVQKLCTQISCWSVAADLALVRLMAYMECEPDLELVGTLAPEDATDLEINVWHDAEWNRDASTTKRPSGLFVELHSPTSGRTFPLVWKTSLQTATASSSAESETVSLSAGLRQEALSVQKLFEVLLGRRLLLRCQVDNTQAVAAAKKGYSKRLRHLSRTHRCSLGVLCELIEDKDACEQRGDLFTKALLSAAFVRALELVGMRRPAL